MLPCKTLLATAHNLSAQSCVTIHGTLHDMPVGLLPAPSTPPDM